MGNNWMNDSTKWNQVKYAATCMLQFEWVHYDYLRMMTTVRCGCGHPTVIIGGGGGGWG